MFPSVYHWNGVIASEVAFERFRVTNSAKLTNLNNMRTANSMLAVDGVEEEVDTIP